MLRQSITQERIIHPSFGRQTFFELAFSNPYPKRAEFAIRIADPASTEQVRELDIVTSVKEWLYLKRLHGLYTDTKTDMFCVRDEEDGVVYMRLEGHETAQIPIRFLSFNCGAGVDEGMERDRPDGANAYPVVGAELDSLQPAYAAMRRRVVQITVENKEREAVCYLNVDVRPAAFPLDHTLRFHHWSEEFLHHTMRLPTLTAGGQEQSIMLPTQSIHGKHATQSTFEGAGATQTNMLIHSAKPIVKVRCSDDDVAFELEQNEEQVRLIHQVS
jgi:hypothetical protein